jgi:hypothetical protein
MAKHSNAGIVSARNASAGHVAHNGIASSPRHVHALGESFRHDFDGGPEAPNQSAVLELEFTAYLPGRPLRR